MKIYYKYSFIIILAVFILAPIKNTFAITCNNGKSASCLTCGMHVYGISVGVNETGQHYIVDYGTCGDAVCGKGVGCSAKLAKPIPSSQTMKYFYENYYMPFDPTWSHSTSVLKPGTKGKEVSSLAMILEGFGFSETMLSDTTPRAVEYESTYGPVTTQAVSGLQKSLKLPVTGNFDPTTNQAFADLYYDISSIVSNPAADTTKLAIIYPGGVTSFFSGIKFDTPSSAVNPFSVSEPTFMMQDSKGKNFLWKSDKWNATQTAFPTLKPATPIKSSLSVLTAKFSIASNNISNNFASNSNQRVIGGTPSAIVPDISDLLRSLGFSAYQATSTDSNFGPILSSATKQLDLAFGLQSNDTFDSFESDTVKDFNSKLVNAVNTSPADATQFYAFFSPNKSMSSFNSAKGVFDHITPGNERITRCEGNTLYDLEPYTYNSQTYWHWVRAGRCGNLGSW